MLVLSAYFSVLAYGNLKKGRVFIESLTAFKELCYPKDKEALLTQLDKAVPTGRQAIIS